ncbi:MAG: hypothetical protein WA146_09740, partial [Thiobacillus sp.]
HVFSFLGVKLRGQDSGIRIQGSGFRDQDSGIRIQGSGFRGGAAFGRAHLRRREATFPDP